MTNIDKIEACIQAGIQKQKRIGFELEHIVCGPQYEIAEYEQVEKCLLDMHKEIGGRLYREDGRVYGIVLPDYTISLEPGCQVEISIAPQKEPGCIEAIYRQFRSVADNAFAEKNLILLTKGVHPLVENGMMEPDKLPLLPRKRYQYMDAYFEKTGKRGKYMMRATASTQVSLDYESMEDAMRKMRVLSRLAPVFALLTENRNGIGKRHDFQPHLLRAQIWNDVDADRCGYFPGSVSPDYSFHAYASYLYTKPCILLQKGDKTISLGECSPQEYYGGRQAERACCGSESMQVTGHADGEEQPEEEMDTQEHLMTMFFPNVRLRTYVEYRVADSMPIEKAAAYAMMIAKLMYTPSILCKLDELTGQVTQEQAVYEAEKEIMKNGYGAVVYGKPVTKWLHLLFDLTYSVCDSAEKKTIQKLLPLPLIYDAYYDLIRGREEQHVEGALAMKDYILHSTAKYHERAVRTLYVPKLFTQRETACFQNLVATLFGIFHKVIAEYETNEAYRKLFGFPEKLEELILRPRTYVCDIPIARIDIFYDEQTGDFKFCEFNTDGTSAMNEDRELGHALSRSEAFEAFCGKYRLRGMELFDTWVDEVLRIYQGAVKSDTLPHVAIVDFLEKGTVNEFEIFRQRFERKGMQAKVCDIRSLRFDGKDCYTDDGMKIDVIYRRAVTTDIMQNYGEISDFLAAVKAEAVLLLGDFRTQIVHNKLLFKILHMEQTMRLLDKKEQVFVQAHVPYTVSLETDLFEKNPSLAMQVRENRERWIIKPEDSYGSKGVHAGVECSRQEWLSFLHDATDHGYILQEFVEPYRTANIDLLNEKTEWITTSNLTGLFVYNGVFKGIYSRVSFDQMISTQYNEMSLATQIVDL